MKTECRLTIAKNSKAEGWGDPADEHRFCKTVILKPDSSGGDYTKLQI